MISQVTKTLEELIRPVVEGMGFEFVGLEFLQQGNRSLLRVYIDSEAGVSVDHCGDVS
ncbi:MAG: hypothetical protein FD130_1133, partial [Halothiobacillaceae bacterium]